MTSDRSTYLVDSNLLVYAIDPSDARKQAIARSALARLVEAGRATLSAQILGETFNAITRRIARPVAAGEAARQLRSLAQSTMVYPISTTTVVEAFRGVVEHQMSYWDALVWATARLNGIETVLTEDIQSGGEVEGVRFLDPFGAGLEVESL